MATSPSPSPNGHARNGHPPDAGASTEAPLPPRRPSRANGARPKARDEAKRAFTVGEIARLLGAQLVGDAGALITGVAGLDATGPGLISFIDNERLLEAALESSAGAIIAPDKIAEQVAVDAASTSRADGRAAKPILLTGNPRLAFARVMEHISPLSLPESGVHPSAVIEPTAHVGAGATIREGCYVGHHAHIGDGAVLYPHVVVGDGAQIGEATILYPSVVILHQVHIGRRVRVHSGTVIGGDGFGYVLDGDKHVKMPQVGRNCILCGQVGLSGSVVVEDNAILAGQAGVKDHVRIGRGTVVGAQAGIMADVEAESYVMGTPATSHGDWSKREVAARKLPETVRALRRLERDVQELQQQLEEIKKQAGE